MTEDTKKKLKALDRANKWAGAGKEAHDLALATEKAALEGEIVPATPKNIETTIKGAIKLFLDGDIKSQKIIEKMQNAGLDMNNLRRSLVEETISRAIPQIVNSGDIERLTQLAQLAGENLAAEIPDGAKRITRERVTIEIE